MFMQLSLSKHFGSSIACSAFSAEQKQQYEVKMRAEASSCYYVRVHTNFRGLEITDLQCVDRMRRIQNNNYYVAAFS